MKAIILAAGQWTRLRPITNTIPKPMIQIASRPIIEHLIENIYDEVDEIIIVVKYLKKCFISYFWNNFKWTKITYFEQGDDKWTWWALRWIKFSWDFLLINWDSIFEKKDFIKIINLSWYWCLTREVENPSKYWVYIKNADLTAIKIIEKPKEFYGNTTNVWVYKFSDKLFEINEKIELSPRWEYEITDSINKFCEIEKFHLINMDWEFVDVWQVEDIEKAEKIMQEILYRKPNFWEYNILEKIWEFYISLWIPIKQVEKLINFSTDKTDIDLINNTWDLNRFSSIEKFEKWYNDENRFLFCLLDKNNNLAWIWWWRPAKLPEIKEILNNEIYEKVLQNVSKIHTSWIRIYWVFRWKWLAKVIFLAEKHYRKIFEKAFICIDINKSNIASQKSYEKQWYFYFANWKNINSSIWEAEKRMLYVSF